MKQWFRFSTDGKNLYGHGTLDQAFEYRNRMRHATNVICIIRALTDQEAQALQLDNNIEAFSLTQALTDASKFRPGEPDA